GVDLVECCEQGPEIALPASQRLVLGLGKQTAQLAVDRLRTRRRRHDRDRLRSRQRLEGETAAWAVYAPRYPRRIPELAKAFEQMVDASGIAVLGEPFAGPCDPERRYQDVRAGQPSRVVHTGVAAIVRLAMQQHARSLHRRLGGAGVHCPMDEQAGEDDDMVAPSIVHDRAEHHWRGESVAILRQLQFTD